MKTFLVTFLLISISINQAWSSQDFNSYILRAVDRIAETKAGLGYDLNSTFSDDLQYGSQVIPAKNPPTTMCVAAVTEVIIEALNLYASETGDRSIYETLPAGAWRTSRRLSLRPYVFMYDSVTSRGTAHALTRFGIGRELPFNKLMPGDFINFNRANKRGHSVIFLGYINRRGEMVKEDDQNLVGFKYFSSQGKGQADAGFGYRNAYFNGFCPSPRGSTDDCKVIKSDNQKYLNSGRIFHPANWKVEIAIRQLKREIERKIARTIDPQSTQFKQSLKRTLTIELAENINPKFDGITDQ